jgi:hypothetical protein
MGGVLRIEPLMLNNKLAVVRINNLINATAGDISAPSSGYTLLGTDGSAFINSGTINLHTAVDYASKRVVVKSTGGVVKVKAESGETIDGHSEIVITSLQAIEIISDGTEWWIMGSYTLGEDQKIVLLLQRIEDLIAKLIVHMEVITDEEIEDE